MFKQIVTNPANGYFSSLPAPLIQYSNRHCSLEAGLPDCGPGLSHRAATFVLRTREIDWEVFMQIRRVLRDYLATVLMDVSFLKVNLTFCFSCQKRGLCGPLSLGLRMLAVLHTCQRTQVLCSQGDHSGHVGITFDCGVM